MPQHHRFVLLGYAKPIAKQLGAGVVIAAIFASGLAVVAEEASIETRAVTAMAEPLPAPDAAKTPRASAADYRALAEAEARRAGMPSEIADAVMAVESGYDPRAIGSSGEIGLMQVLPSTARMMGFVGGNDALASPQTNIHYGVTYLARAWRLAGGDLCTAVMKYRAGHGETRFSYRSVDYCVAVRAKLAARGYHVTGAVPIATFGESPRATIAASLDTRCRRNCLAASSSDRLDFGTLNARLDRVVAQASANAARLR